MANKDFFEGTTSTGFSYKLDKNKLNDYRIFELLSQLEDNPLLLPKFIIKILGAEQKEALLKHLEKDGTVPIDAIEKEITEIFNQHQDLKN